MTTWVADIVRGRPVMYTRDQAPGAELENGARVIKMRHEPYDAHAAGALGTVVGSLYSEELREHGYFIAWDDAPDVPVFVRYGTGRIARAG